MSFTFEELEILKETFTSADKTTLLKTLESLNFYTDDKDLKEILNGLINKIDSLSDRHLEQLYKDRLEYKLSIYPFYVLEID